MGLACFRRPLDPRAHVDHERKPVHLLRRERRRNNDHQRSSLDADHADRRAAPDPGRSEHVQHARHDQDAAMRRVARQEEGFAMVMVLGMTVLLLVLAFGLIDVMQSEASRSRTAVKRDAAYQAAEAGVDDYIAKLIDDRLYYVHFVHTGEATRRATASGRPDAASSPRPPTEGNTRNI